MGNKLKDYTQDVTLIRPTGVIVESKNVGKWKTREGQIQLEKWAMEGLSYSAIARKMGVSRNMLQRWREEYYEISEAIERGMDFANGEVVNALFKKATGYTIQKTVIDNKGEEHIIDEYVQPDIKAIQYWLNNRAKKDWSANVTHQTNIAVPIIVGENFIKD
jgi:transcriptional regulator with XRE-family HTH domain